MPFHQLITINGLKIFDTTLTEVSLNPALSADAFTVPDALRGKAAAPAPVETVKWQWSSGEWVTASASTPILTTRTTAEA
jgi:hypothetical protein